MSGSGTFNGDVFKAAGLLQQAASLGEAIYQDVHAAIAKHRPELVPAELPERSDEAIKRETDRLIRERFPESVVPAAPPPGSTSRR